MTGEQKILLNLTIFGQKCTSVSRKNTSLARPGKIELIIISKNNANHRGAATGRVLSRSKRIYCPKFLTMTKKSLKEKYARDIDWVIRDMTLMDEMSAVISNE